MTKYAVEHHQESDRHIVWSFKNDNKYRMGSYETAAEAVEAMERSIALMEEAKKETATLGTGIPLNNQYGYGSE